MNYKKDLTQGHIGQELLLLTIPLVLSSLLQTLYNVVDTFWLATVGAKAVSAAGLAGMYMWMAFGFILLTKAGIEILVSQYAGQNDFKRVSSTINNGFKLSLLISIIYGLILLIFAPQLIGFFKNSDPVVNRDAILYLRLIAISIPAYFMMPVISATFNGFGRTKIPLMMGGLGLVINMILDPYFIYILKLGVAGAAIATSISLYVALIVYIIYIKVKEKSYPKINFFSKMDKEMSVSIMRIGFPMAIQSIFFTSISMIVTTFVSPYGPDAIAAQRVGTQIEAVSYMVGGGISTALTAFIGQNYGAQSYHRIREAFNKAFVSMFIYGLIVTLALFFFAKPIMGMFAKEPGFLAYGIIYLKIIAFSQIAQIIEGVMTGSFSGLGYTKAPSIIGITGNLIRIPLALALASIWGVYGIWLAITISSIIKMVTGLVWMPLYLKTLQKRGIKI